MNIRVSSLAWFGPADEIDDKGDFTEASRRRRFGVSPTHAATMSCTHMLPLLTLAWHMHRPVPLDYRSALSANRLAVPLMVSRSSAELAKKIDAACEASISAAAKPPSLKEVATRTFGTPEELAQLEQERTANFEEEARRQSDLARVYEELVESGDLQAFGSVQQSPVPGRTVSPEDQLRLTGLPTTAFAPRGSGGGPLFAGALTALGLAVISSNLEIDFRAIGGIAALVLLLDNIVFAGVGLEVLARILRPAYQRTIIEHEAGHFLTAYLLGCPIEACLLDPIAAARDARFQGAAGTVFFDPLLAEAMRSGKMPRSSVDRYSVVVMAGIAAEAELNGKAEGGRADEEALIRLLVSLDNGRSWDLGRVQNQARWAASGAALILRAHRPAYDALVEALTAGKSVGECIVAIENAIRTNPPKMATAVPSTDGIDRVDDGEKDISPPPSPPPISREEALAKMAERKEEVSSRLEEVKKRLEELQSK
eukprot:scaffold15934_cov30-Tisochrysis_lutea.AAC.1